MDNVTQQNASLVEEASAAAASLEEQAARLTEAVGTFRLQASERVETVNATAKAAFNPARPTAATAGADNWETF